jgi:AraC family transcriptional regulator
MSPTNLEKSPQPSLQGPRLENAGSFLIAGLRRHYTEDRISNIPAQWQQFAGYLGRIPGRVGHTTYGVCLNPTNGAVGIDYLSGVEVSCPTGLPDDLGVVTIPAQPYAVFVHRGNVSQLRDSLDAIWQKRLPESGYEVGFASAESPAFFERYTDRFDSRTASGEVELWIPIKS